MTKASANPKRERQSNEDLSGKLLRGNVRAAKLLVDLRPGVEDLFGAVSGRARRDCGP